MCLYVNRDKQFEVAKRDFTVYKVMIKVSEKSWKTPYRGFLVRNITENVTTLEPKRKTIQRSADYNMYADVIEGGLIHGFQTSLEARDMLRRSFYPAQKSYTHKRIAYIWQMTIPKGTEYIVGRCGEIGAKKMIFKKMLKMK